MPRFDYMRLKLTDLPNNFVEQYKLSSKLTKDEYVYVEIRRGMYGYCSRFQVERNSTWNHYMPRNTGKARNETFSILASDCQHGRHKITTYPETYMVLFYIGSYLRFFKAPKTALDPKDDKHMPSPNTMTPE